MAADTYPLASRGGGGGAVKVPRWTTRTFSRLAARHEASRHRRAPAVRVIEFPALEERLKPLHTRSFSPELLSSVLGSELRTGCISVIGSTQCLLGLHHLSTGVNRPSDVISRFRDAPCAQESSWCNLMWCNTPPCPPPAPSHTHDMMHLHVHVEGNSVQSHTTAAGSGRK